jgi:hypothetical protein
MSIRGTGVWGIVRVVEALQLVGVEPEVDGRDLAADERESDRSDSPSSARSSPSG